MKQVAVSLIFAFGAFMTGTTLAENPLLEKWTTPFGVPPFDAIQIEQYEPAFAAAMQEHKQEIRAIYVKRSVPTFENTIAALDRSGALLDQVSNVFFAMTSSMSTDELQAIAKNIAPRKERNHCRLTCATKTKGKGTKNSIAKVTNLLNKIAITNRTVTKKNFILGSKS